MTKLMVSFCNVFPRGLALGIFDYDLANFKWIDLRNILEYKKITGVTGICLDRNGSITYWFATQEENFGSTLLALDRNFDVFKIYKLVRTLDAHSITPFENGLLITHTRGNGINKIEIGSDKSVFHENVYWRYWDEQTTDVVHVNSVSVVNGHVYTSIFGHTPEEGWSHARNGKIINISENKIICDNLFHPHSLINIDGILYWLESGTSKVHRFCEDKGHQIITTLSGYLRGITYDHEYIYIASSAARRKSRRTGTENVPPSNPDDMHSWIYRINRKTLEADRRKLTLFGAEIFDLVILEDSHLQNGIDITEPILRRLWRYDEEYLYLNEQCESKTGELSNIIEQKENQIKQLNESIAIKDSQLKQLAEEIKLLQDINLNNQKTIEQKENQIKQLNGVQK